MRKNFKRIGNKLAFNSMDADPIFDIIQELEHGYTYFMTTKPFGELMYVSKELVEEESDEEEELEQTDIVEELAKNEKSSKLSKK